MCGGASVCELLEEGFSIDDNSRPGRGHPRHDRPGRLGTDSPIIAGTDDFMTLTLIGYRGSGKSTIAPLVAGQLGWSWIDSDIEVEERAGQSIQQIFASESESGFRQRETAVMEELLGRQQVVIAAGGGAILAEQNRVRMKQAGPVIWLTAAATTLAERVLSDRTTADRRPSLTGRPVDEEIREVLEIRTPMYQDAATHTVDTEALSREEIVAQIVAIVRAESLERENV